MKKTIIIISKFLLASRFQISHFRESISHNSWYFKTFSKNVPNCFGPLYLLEPLPIIRVGRERKERIVSKNTDKWDRVMCQCGARLAPHLTESRTGIQYRITMDWYWCILQVAAIQHHITMDGYRSPLQFAGIPDHINMDWYRSILPTPGIREGKILYYLFFFECLNIIYNDLYITIYNQWFNSLEFFIFVGNNYKPQVK